MRTTMFRRSCPETRLIPYIPAGKQALDSKTRCAPASPHNRRSSLPETLITLAVNAADVENESSMPSDTSCTNHFGSNDDCRCPGEVMAFFWPGAYAGYSFSMSEMETLLSAII